MTDEERVIKFAQKAYLIRTGRYFDDLEESDGQVYLSQVVDWTQMFIDELAEELKPDGQPIDWWWSRDSDHVLGTVDASDTTFELDDDIERLVVNQDRPLAILQDGSIICTWEVVNINHISRNRNVGNKVAQVGRKLVFSRPFNDTEIGGTVIADVMNYLPELTLTSAELLDTVKPNSLLLLGLAKNITLPDIVQGGLSPSYAQKYAELLGNAKAKSEMSSESDMAGRQDFSDIGGIYG